VCPRRPGPPSRPGPTHLAGGAVTLDVAKVRGCRAGCGLGVNDEPRLDRHAPGTWPQPAAQHLGRDMAAPLLGAATAAARQWAASAGRGLLRRPDYLAGEPLRARVSAPVNLAGPDAEAILVRTGHGSGSSVVQRARHASSLLLPGTWPCSAHRAGPAACRRNRRADKGVSPGACRALLSCPQLLPTLPGHPLLPHAAPICTSVSPPTR